MMVLHPAKMTLGGKVVGVVGSKLRTPCGTTEVQMDKVLSSHTAPVSGTDNTV